MATTQTTQIWQARQLNHSGIRRLKILDADSTLIIPGTTSFDVSLLPLAEVTMYEFVFPSDLSCVASSVLGKKESGAAFWIQNIAFTLPHLQEETIKWAHNNAVNKWLAICEAYNGEVRLMGGSPGGLEMNFQASSGASPADANPMAFSLSAEQFFPHCSLQGYDDSVLFPADSGFTYGFSFGFES